MCDLSVAIRTYNRAEKLPALLDALSQQVNVSQLDWEIIVVDNNSTDPTQAVVAKYQQGWTSGDLRYVLETRQGASFARQRAIAEARGCWIAFLDDDNVPAEDWVSAAYVFAMAHPKAAAFGGQIHARYEVPPPPHFERLAPFIPVVERDEEICFTTGWRAMSNLVPPGAGLVVRRAAWQAHVPDELVLKGPVGDSLSLKGEDVEALLHLKKAGWDIWFNPAMHIRHDIPRHRFERDYLLGFFHGIGLSKYTTRMVPYPQWQRPAMTGLYLLSDLRKVVSHLFRYRQTLPRDLVAACELRLFVSSLLGPFYGSWQKLVSGVFRHNIFRHGVFRHAGSPESQFGPLE